MDDARVYEEGENRIGKSQVLAEEFLDRLLKVKEMEKQLSAYNVGTAIIEQKLYEQMEQDELPDINIKGIRFKPEIQQKFKLLGFHPKTSWDAVKEWFDWLKKIGEEGLIKVKETVHWKTRDAFLKGYIKLKHIELIDPLDSAQGEQEVLNQLPPFIEESFHPVMKYNKSELLRMADGKN